MTKLTLVDEGVFPITVDNKGDHVTEPPKTGWHFAGTVQGEGKLAGVPSLFVRLASCNLRCIWQLPNNELCTCDTTYASFYPENTQSWDVEEIVQTIKNNIGAMHHVVITGGEPFLQKQSLAGLCKRIKDELNLHITIETNGTIFDSQTAPYIDLVSLSPKLKNSEPTPEKLAQLGIATKGPFAYHAETRKQTDVLQQWMDASKQYGFDFQIKFVVAQPNEANEIKNDFLNHLNGWKSDDILLMPLGTNHMELGMTAPVALMMAVQSGWRYSPRVHIDLFGCKKGV